MRVRGNLKTSRRQIGGIAGTTAILIAGLLSVANGCSDSQLVSEAKESSVAAPLESVAQRSGKPGSPHVSGATESPAGVDSDAIRSIPRLVPRSKSSGIIESVPFTDQAPGKGAALFETLDAKAIGIDFFHEKSKDRFLSPELAIGSGVAMGDYDGDGLVDVFLPRSTDGGRLFRNLGNFRFEDVSSRAGIIDGPGRWTTGATFVDVDNDNDLDLYVCGHGCPNHLYVNQGDGTFVERGRQHGLDCVRASVMMCFADYDRDGDLDAYLVTNHQPPASDFEFKLEYDQSRVPHVPDRYLEYRDLARMPKAGYIITEAGQYDYLYRNNGDGTFSDVSEAAGIRGAAAQIRGNDRGLSATWWDYNSDGWADLYVANDFAGGDRLYRNNGNGTFSDVIAAAIPHTPWFSMGSDTGDIDNDGKLDFMGTDMSEQTDYRQKVARRNPQTGGWFLDYPTPRQYARNAVYLNTGADRFHEIAYLAGLESSGWTWSVRLVDLDQDGNVDVHITNGMSLDLDNNDLKNAALKLGPVDSEAYRDFWARQPMLRQRNVAFQNRGALKFTDVSRQWGLDHFGVSYGAAFGDLDNDGDLDLVINNIDDRPTIARNVGTRGHAVRVRLQGTRSNRWGIGATVRALAGGKRQTGYLTHARGFMSASDPTIHFGLGEAEVIDELVVEWPSGQRQLFRDFPADRLYSITEPESALADPDEPSEPKPMPLFARSGALIPVKHDERPFDDFAREPLLPFRLSQLGPGMAVGDVSGDGLEDLYVGSGLGSLGSLLVDSASGKWSLSDELFPLWFDDVDCEQMGVLLFDADGDDDLDLFVVSGGVECESGNESLGDRLYLNDGKGGFSRPAAGQMPDLRESGSVAAAADYDRDGDLDLFVGGRCVPGRFPEIPTSHLLSNDAGRFRDVTARVAPDVQHSGLVTSALWSDVNADGWIDLFVTHEWGPIKLFINDRGMLRDATTEAELADLRGWWNGVAGRDLDGDGDIDYVCTNLGRNTAYRVSADRPARLFYGDFNDDGHPVLVEGWYDEQGRLVPTRSKPEMERAIPGVEAAFPTFQEYASATLADVVDSKMQADSLQVSANTVDSVVLRNDGRGHFRVEPLPMLAQIAPGYGVVLSDLNADGRTDVYLVQNSFAPRREIGRMDGGASALFFGQPDGTLATVPFDESGLMVPGDAKSVVVTDVNGDAWPDLVVGVNDAEMLVFENQKVPRRRMATVRLRGRPGNPTGVGARVTLHRSDGLQQTAEVQAGGGYLSQQSATLYFGLGEDSHVEAVEVRWPDGQTTRQRPQPDAPEEMRIVQPGAQDE